MENDTNEKEYGNEGLHICLFKCLSGHDSKWHRQLFILKVSKSSSGGHNYEIRLQNEMW